MQQLSDETITKKSCNWVFFICVAHCHGAVDDSIYCMPATINNYIVFITIASLKLRSIVSYMEEFFKNMSHSFALIGRMLGFPQPNPTQPNPTCLADSPMTGRGSVHSNSVPECIITTEHVLRNTTRKVGTQTCRLVRITNCQNVSLI